MTLLEWDAQGRKGRFETETYTLTGGGGGLTFQPIIPKGFVGFNDLTHFPTLHKLCRYLGHIPSKIEGEVVE